MFGRLRSFTNRCEQWIKLNKVLFTSWVVWLSQFNDGWFSLKIIKEYAAIWLNSKFPSSSHEALLCLPDSQDVSPIATFLTYSILALTFIFPTYMHKLYNPLQQVDPWVNLIVIRKKKTMKTHTRCGISICRMICQSKVCLRSHYSLLSPSKLCTPVYDGIFFCNFLKT